ncbi:MAG: hypothetical protein EOP62_06765 [Sphingomonadales bacterium]|nr:MAG: hypothetical protein EOP62_06765 [Sphingomonadales bacterium]
MKALLLALALLVAAPALAQNWPAEFRPTKDEEVVFPLLRLADQAHRRGDHPGGLAYAEQAIAMLPRATPFRAFLNCNYGQGMLGFDKAKARIAIEECRTGLPGQSIASMAYSGLLLAEGKREPGYRMMVEAIRSDPRWVQQCDTTANGEIRTQLRVMGYERELDDVRAALIETLIGTACGSEDPGFYSGLMRDVIAKRLARGEIEKAREGIPAVLDPDDVLKMLVDRRYEKIWGDIERQTGGNLEALRVAFVHKVRQGYVARPNIDTATGLAYALTVTGGLDEGIALLAKAMADPALATDELYDEGRAAVRMADMRNAAGEMREAVVTAAFRKLLDGGSPEKTSSLWNVIPNLARWMIIYGKPGEALALLDKYVPGSNVLDSPAARGYFAALRGCAQLRGGDRAGQQALQAVIKDYTGNSGAVRIAATCGTDRAVLRTEILALMDDEDERADLLLDMVRIKALGANGRKVTSVEHAALTSLLADPVVAKRLGELARDPGPGYRAALSRWKMP